MYVDVTQEDIDLAKTIKTTLLRSMNCPVAQALLRITGEDYVSVGGIYACVGNKMYLLPPMATLAIGKFDSGLEMKPFQFEMESNGVKEGYV